MSEVKSSESKKIDVKKELAALKNVTAYFKAKKKSTRRKADEENRI